MLLLIPRSLAPASYLIERFKASGPLLQTLFLRVQVKTDTQGDGNNIPGIPSLLASPTPCTKYFPSLS